MQTQRGWGHSSAAIAGLAVAALALGLGAGPARAGFVQGYNPFIDYAGTGTASHNGAGGVSGWTDNSPRTGPYVAVGGPTMYYREAWASTRSIGQIQLYTSDRAAAGSLYISTNAGGPYTTWVTNFSLAANTELMLDVELACYGVEVNVTNDLGTGYYQFGDVHFLKTGVGQNLSAGATPLTSPGSAWTGSVCDNSVWTQWRAGTGQAESYCAFEFPGGAARTIRALRVSGTVQHGYGWGWHNYDVQLKQGGTWSTIGRASVPSPALLYWIDLGEATDVQGVRLYGSVAGGNDPCLAGGGYIIDEIYAYRLPPPLGTMIELR